MSLVVFISSVSERRQHSHADAVAVGLIIASGSSAFVCNDLAKPLQADIQHHQARCQGGVDINLGA
jgi:hypothetical protein